MKGKLNTKEKKLMALIVAMAIAIFGLIVGMIGVSHKKNKYEMILDIACGYSYDVKLCRQGMRYLKNMSTEEIEYYRR